MTDLDVVLHLEDTGHIGVIRRNRINSFVGYR